VGIIIPSPDFFCFIGGQAFVMTPTPIVILSRRVCDVPKDPTNGVLAFPMGSFGSTAFRSGRQGGDGVLRRTEGASLTSASPSLRMTLYSVIPSVAEESCDFSRLFSCALSPRYPAVALWAKISPLRSK
jgi:hypothetical protein